ncbi:MAG: M20 family metallo-hydrolase [Cyclobacteriaceae bacterium]
MSVPSSVERYNEEAIELLSSLIRTQSFSREEEGTAAILEVFFVDQGIPFERKGNNVWAKNKYFDLDKETILLNSHHDTVRPNEGYSKDPLDAVVEEGMLYGLGSNDAGGCLVSLLLTFAHFYDQEKLPFNLVMAATAEEEISGKGGLESILNEIEPIKFAIVGEPTEMKMAVAEKGLMVLDCKVRGKSGHAAREGGVNAIYEALEVIEWFKTYQFEKESDLLGPVKMSVTMIESGYQHNVVPDICDFVVDVRTTDAYTNEEVLEIIQQHVNCEVQARSTRLKPSGLPEKMLLYQVAKSLDIEQFGSSTTSDQAILDIPSAKMGPGKSERSHTADEFIHLEEIKEGIERYIELLEELFRT